MRSEKITLADVGKIFVLAPDELSGQMMSCDDFLKLPVDQIGKWDYVGEFDVNT